MIDYIEFVEYDDYLGLGVPVADGGQLPPLSGYPSYPGEYDTFGVEKIPYYDPTQSYNQYTKVFDFVYPEVTVTNDSGFFAQAPSQCSFSLRSDAFLLEILNPDNDKDYKYSKYVVRVFEDSLVIFEGIIVLDQLTYLKEKDLINFTCFDFLVLVSDLKQLGFSTKNTQIGSFIEVIRNNKTCMRFIFSYVMQRYFNGEPDNLIDEIFFKDFDVNSMIKSDKLYDRDPTAVSYCISCIFYEEVVGDTGLANWKYLGFTSFNQLKGRLILIKWQVYDISGTTVYTIRFTVLEKDDIPSEDDWWFRSTEDNFENDMRALNILEPSNENYNQQKFTKLGAEFEGTTRSKATGELTLETGIINAAYFTFDVPIVELGTRKKYGFYFNQDGITPPPIDATVNEWLDMQIGSGYSIAVLKAEIAYLIDTIPDVTYDLGSNPVIITIIAVYNGVASGLVDGDTGMAIGNSVGTYSVSGSENEYYAYLDLENKKMNALRFDTEYTVRNSVYWWDVTAGLDGNWIQDIHEDTKYLYVPSFDYYPIDTAYFNNSLKEQENKHLVRIYRITIGGLDYAMSVWNGQKWVEIYLGFSVQYTYDISMFRVFKTTDSENGEVFIYDIRHFMHIYSDDGWFTWRYRTIVKVSGAIFISATESYNVAYDPSGNDDFYNNSLYTEYYEGIDVIPLGETYYNLGTNSTYFGNTTFEEKILDPINTWDYYFGWVVSLRGYTFSEYMGWQIGQAFTIENLMQGVLHFNNVAIRVKNNQIYFEGRTSSLPTTEVSINNNAIIEPTFSRIYEESPDTSYLDYVDQDNADRVKDVIVNFYITLFKTIRRKVNCTISYIYDNYDLLINNIVGIDGIIYKIVKIVKKQDNIYEIEAWNTPYSVYGTIKEGDATTIRVYGLIKAGDATVRVYGMKGI